MKIERAVIEDAPGIMALQKLAYRSEAQIYNDFSIQPLMQTMEDLKGEFQVYVKLVADPFATDNSQPSKITL